MDTCLDLKDQTAALAGLLERTDPALPVPTCPLWTLADLAAHVGHGQRWTAELLRTGTPPPQPEGGAPAEPGPWLRESAELVAEAVGADPDAVVWTFLGPRPARFWSRRMRNDVLVHRADAALAAGEDFTAPAATAADAMSEGLDLLTASVNSGLSPALAELRGNGVLKFAADDTGGVWTVRRTPEAVLWSEKDEPADVTVRGGALDLLLVLTRRASPERVRVRGDEALLRHWLEHSAF
ncbi:maleylpyruvate isomerase family mycothiol-dependent enzyme [Actinocorallia populi]|uniref:maleylpyruvate isomerase family mycothiol-dependent enzyme n=1 Tax=Actinocorallia populi TaxID=2079200 RepID=UPI000D0912E1|nr:maleylpyruvate isomerase family mycothiol-dependent enzyme [Actinocorallia populi]